MVFRSLLDKLKHHTYTPDRTAGFERQVAMFANRAMAGKVPIKRPVAMKLIFMFEGEDGLWPTDVTDGDIDNLEKAIKDALNGIAYLDDRLVVELEKTKICRRDFGVHVVFQSL